MRIFGIDPGSVRTGYGCVETDGTRHRLVACGVVSGPSRASFPDRLRTIHDGLLDKLRAAAPDCVALENLFHARHARSALLLGHARGVAMLAVMEAGLPLVEYTPAEVKLAVTGYGRAEKTQMQQMVTLLLGLERTPSPHDAADALALAICHAHRAAPSSVATPSSTRTPRHLRSWRHAQIAGLGRRRTP
ncbi:MAG TPA: crossover junction endodeoxyribonuclease RuvC [Vicinamibacterales bacterium]|nr:crossover junction endodeoxyribonuclease RuvC [Vicinamibacterales bacterium]